MNVLTVLGNRPQFVKAAAVSPALRARHRETLVHTGQHHDRELSAVFFDELALPTPNFELGVAGGANESQVERMVAALEPVMAAARPDLALVYGDTNSTLAGALAAVAEGVPCVHVEAGMRSFDTTMPEERIRVRCDQLCELLLCPGETAAANLRAESVTGRIAVVGDVMGDVVLAFAAAARDRASLLDKLGVTPGAYVYLTAHRAGNVDDPQRLERLVALIGAIPHPVVFAIHPRTRERLAHRGFAERLDAMGQVVQARPFGYVDSLALVASARAVITDSGGLQKEACWLGTQCVTLRDTTEWVETVETGWNTLVDLDAAAMTAALAAGPPRGRPPALYGAGSAGPAVVDAIERFVADRAA